MRIILIDNYDSFTYNLVHYFEKWGAQVDVVLNDGETPSWVLYDACVVSPGPGLPDESNKLMSWLIQWREMGKPLLGVCLGLQAMVQSQGGGLKQLAAPMHGVEGEIKEIATSSLWSSLTYPQTIAHYHSWVADEQRIPPHLQVTARDVNNEIMVVENRDLGWFGVQFHPESIMTPDGFRWIELWCKEVEERMS
jgi:anthranilate synthase component II